MSEQQTGNPNQGQPVSPAWINVERARHPQRPTPMNFIERIFTDFSEIHGDRAFGDDEALESAEAAGYRIDRLLGTSAEKEVDEEVKRKETAKSNVADLADDKEPKSKTKAAELIEAEPSKP